MVPGQVQVCSAACTSTSCLGAQFGLHLKLNPENSARSSLSPPGACAWGPGASASPWLPAWCRQDVAHGRFWMQGADGVLEISSTVERQRGSRWGLAYLVARWHRATSASRIQDFLPLEDSKPSQSPGGWQKAMPLSPPEGFWLRSNFASEASYPRGGGGLSLVSGPN